MNTGSTGKARSQVTSCDDYCSVVDMAVKKGEELIVRAPNKTIIAQGR